MDPNLSQYENVDFREFAVEQLGEQARTMPAPQVQRILERKAKKEKWLRNRDLYKDKCSLCGFEALHTSTGRAWNLTKAGEYYEHPKRTSKRPNFKWLPKKGGWICQDCVRRRYPHHSDSGIDKKTRKAK